MKPLPSTAVLDTNILLLWLVSLTDESLLTTFKRVDTFRAEDLTLLANVLRGFQHLTTTPHILTEVSNFIDQAPQYRRHNLIVALEKFVVQHKEVYEEATKLIERNEFRHLGLADTGLVALSSAATVITGDFHLWGRITSNGGRCINFTHLRSGPLLPTK